MLLAISLSEVRSSLLLACVGVLVALTVLGWVLMFLARLLAARQAIGPQVLSTAAADVFPAAAGSIPPDMEAALAAEELPSLGFARLTVLTSSSPLLHAGPQRSGSIPQGRPWVS